VVAGAWLAVDVLLAFGDLDDARDSLSGAADLDRLLTADGRASISDSLATADRSADQARDRLQSSVPLRALAVVPGLGHQRRAAILLARDTAVTAAEGRSLVEVIDRVGAGNRIEGGRLPLEAMVELETAAARAASVLRPTVRRSASLWGPINDARDAYDEEVGDAAVRLADAADALRAARSFAAQGGTRRYLVAGQNNAEMRDQGMVLSYAVLRFADGRFDVERSGSVTDLSLAAAAPTPVPEGTASLFGGLEPTRLWQSVNASADVTWSAAAMLDMVRAATGVQLDGVVMLDVPALAQLLRVIGPVAAEGIPEAVTAQNAARLLLSDLYAALPVGADQGPRREAIAGVARAAVRRAASEPLDALQLGRAVANAARGGHFRLYSRDATEQATFERIGLSGGPAVPPEDAARTFHYSVQNATGTKLDYYVRHRVRFDVTVTDAGNAVVKTTVGIANGAPADAPASYVMGPTANQARPGQYTGRVYLWGPAGSGQFESVEEAGLRATVRTIVAEPQGFAEAAFETLIRGAASEGVLSLRLVPQPLLVPATVEVFVDGEQRLSRKWDRTIDVELDV